MRPTFTILLPTTCRPTLARTLRSIRGQLLPGDAVLCVCGPPHEDARRMFEASFVPGRFVQLPARGTDWGHHERNATMHLARTPHLMHIDDDDEYAPGALAIVRAAVALAPDRPHIFRFRHGAGEKPWPDISRGKLLAKGNVGTPCLVHPVNMRAKFQPFRGGDGDFILDTCKQCPEGPVFHDDVIVLCRGITPLK